jgi:hypothetical protein
MIRESASSFQVERLRHPQVLRVRAGRQAAGARPLGLSLILLGTGALVAASLQHLKELRILDPGATRRRWSLSLTIAAAISLIGVLPFSSCSRERDRFEHEGDARTFKPRRFAPSAYEVLCFSARQELAKEATALGASHRELTTRLCSRRPSAQALRSRYSGMWN